MTPVPISRVDLWPQEIPRLLVYSEIAGSYVLSKSTSKNDEMCNDKPCHAMLIDDLRVPDADS